MASNVFGVPITKGSRSDRAREAKNYPDAGGKQSAAIDYVTQKQKEFGGVATLCLFYNATGETLFVDKNHSFYGYVFDSYPTPVKNGQWGAFLHASNKEKKEQIPSMGYVAYKVKGINNVDVWPLMGVENRQQATDHTHSFCDIYDDEEKIDPDVIYGKIDKSGTACTPGQKNGILINTNIGTEASPFFYGYFNLGDQAE